MDEDAREPDGPGLAGNVSPDGNLLFLPTRARRTGSCRGCQAQPGQSIGPILPVAGAHLQQSRRVSPDGHIVALAPLDANSLWTTDLETRDFADADLGPAAIR